MRAFEELLVRARVNWVGGGGQSARYLAVQLQCSRYVRGLEKLYVGARDALTVIDNILDVARA